MKDIFVENGELNAPACSLPWTNLLVSHEGYISFCCYHPPIAHINNISENAINEIWNGKSAQHIRKCWRDGRLEGTPCGRCVGLERFRKYEHIVKKLMPSAITHLEDKASVYSNAKKNYNEFCKAKSILESKPVEVVYIPASACNIKCIHCNQPLVDSYHMQDELLSKFYHIFGNHALKHVFSGGESLFLPHVSHLNDEISLEHKASSQAVFQTNGMLIKDKFNSFRGFRKYGFTISITSTRKNVYEYFQKKAKFEKLLENLEFIKQLRSEGVDIYLILVMVVMKSNFSDLRNIFNFAEMYNFDEVWITPVSAPYSRRLLLQTENIFALPHLLEEIPSWRDILEEASYKALETGYKLAHYHLEYIKSRFSNSFIENRGRSIQNLQLWIQGLTSGTLPNVG